ncbi:MULTISPECIES: endo-1,4-beta-xylanase [Aliiglaciecola]|uniref:endo-1,4-beta-xylanase n=1 Tax=Aliiglaciecola TaxID=1406885 RepID=UPI001C0A02EA|nr:MULTISPECIES: endo-1,4-beta-xylanase [Aliiglaciecola]MBU2879924.1 endo-1,4-beta-xylanase [Aliiglaciecola lipolytica]MDO6712392.1 endo-1,4-beta-xylanase [Aliiglaciecola sp. 2_MG-2023]MDO6753386.1 endo-1,4-beta-xylanase [Aliiglaciecola sp. 1_MG-2023]
MKKSIICYTGLATLLLLLVACGDDNSMEDSEAETPIVEVPETPELVAVEIANGGFEEDTAGETSPLGNWVFRPDQEPNAASTIEVIESEQGLNSYKGTKAVEVVVSALGDNPWGIEIAYEDILVTGGTNYEFSVWVKGEKGTSADFWVQTPAPAYGQRSLVKETLTGEWQKITLTASTAEADSLIRLAIHFSKTENINKPIYIDEFSGFVLEDVPAEEIPEVQYSPVTAQSLKAIAPGFNLGAAVPAGGFDNSIIDRPEVKTIIEQHFNQLSAENIMKPTYMQPVQGEFFYDDADELVNYAKDNALTVHGHVFIWHSQIAPWMQSFEGDRDDWVTMMEEHITQVATHFEEAGENDTVVSWDVVNEAFMENGKYRGEKTTNDSADESVWFENIGAEFLPLAFKAARAADPDADLYYNDYNLIWNADKLDAVIAMVNDFHAHGVPIDGVGFQSHISLNSPDIATIQAQLQKVVDIRPKIKVKITELDVRMNNEGGTPLTYLSSERADEQKRYYYDVVKTYLETVPVDQRGGITFWGVIDGDSWLQNWPAPTTEWPLLFFNDYTAKPALQGVADALEELIEVVDAPVAENKLTNGDFEAGLTSWQTRGSANITLATTQAHSGNNSALVQGRTETWNGIQKDVKGLFTAGEMYKVSAWVKLSDDSATVSPGIKLTLEIAHASTEYLELTPVTTVAAGDWVQLTGTYTHSYTTEESVALLYIESNELTADFYVDDVSVTLIEE